MSTTFLPPRPATRLAAIHLPLSPRVALVTMDTVIAARGQCDHTILRYVESGRLRWVFDVAIILGGMRNLRFWNREVSAFATTHGEELAAIRAAAIGSVVNEILGNQQEFLPGDICLLLGICRPTLMRLRAELLATGRKLFPRAGLERFLKRRLVR